MASKRTVILGASDKPERFAYRALSQLRAAGHPVEPVNPRLSVIDGTTVHDRLEAVPGPVDTVTVYLSAGNSSPLGDSILSVSPRRVIFNPGAENPDLARRLRAAGVEVVEDCTLVMLDAGRY